MLSLKNQALPETAGLFVSVCSPGILKSADAEPCKGGIALKAAESVVSASVSIAADVVTMGGAMTDKELPFTVDACADLAQNVKVMTTPKKRRD